MKYKLRKALQRCLSMPSFRSPSRPSFINLIPFIFLLFHHSSSDSYLLFNSSFFTHLPTFPSPPSLGWAHIMFPRRSWFLCDTPTSASFLPFFASCCLYYISHSLSQQLALPRLSLSPFSISSLTRPHHHYYLRSPEKIDWLI